MRRRNKTEGKRERDYQVYRLKSLDSTGKSRFWRATPAVRRSGFLDREQPPVLEYRVAVGHAGDVVGDGARGVGARLRLEIRGQHARIREKCLKELAHDAARLGAHAHHAVMAVEVLVQEAL